MKSTLSISALLIAAFLCCNCSKKDEDTAPSEVSSQPKEHESTSDGNEPSPIIPELDSSLTEPSPDQEAATLGMRYDYEEAEAYIAEIAKNMHTARTQNDLATIQKLLGDKPLSAEQQIRLRELLTNKNIKINSENPFTQIGELQANKHARWAINLENSAPIILDVKRNAKGNWKVDSITLPKENATVQELPNKNKDALNYTHTFLTQLLKQDFETAKSMVNNTNITDAKLAGLCIIFEEAAYSINEDKPLRALYMRDTAAGFYANVISKEGDSAAQFSIIAQRENTDDDWSIYEINLDKLLGDYAKRVSGGDVHYTPLLKNPQGGDTLVIYFEFDSEGLTERTQNQLLIVTNLLKLDPNKTITISGHADALGGTEYNVDLSKKRADSVKNFFIANGVLPDQVITEAHGNLKPRRPNTNSDGSDNPDGRRANRRTEIYLDF